MANYSIPWTLAPSFISGDSSVKGTMPSLQSSGESLLIKQYQCGEAGLPEKQQRGEDILYVTIHQAKRIHNTCIYGGQDVYAKFLLMHCQDVVYSTRPVKGCRQNPVFNQSFEIPVTGQDPILKCELWMMNCARNYTEDQLLGFVLLPLKSLYGKGKETRDYGLTSTDGFYTPAGMVRLSLSILHNNSMAVGGELSPVSLGSSHSDFQEAMVDFGQQNVTPASMCKAKFSDSAVAAEDQHLVSMYYKLVSFEECNEPRSSSGHSGKVESASEHARVGTPFNEPHAEYVPHSEMENSSMVLPLVHIHTSPMSSVDDEMVVSPRKDECMCLPFYLPVLEASSEMQELVNVDVGKEFTHSSVEIQLPASGEVAAERASKRSPEVVVREATQGTHINSSTCQADQVMLCSTPLVNISVEPEIMLNEEHFVDLYLKSLQQFTDKLAEMKFIFDINSKDITALRSVQLDRKVAEERKKEGSKLYYGSNIFY